MRAPPARRRCAASAAALLLIGTGVACSAPGPTPRPGWELGPSLPEAFGELATATLRDEHGAERLVVLSGLAGLGRVLDRVYVYDPAEARWSEGPRLPARRHHAAAASLDGELYLAGGSASLRGRPWEPAADVWRLDAQGLAWTAVEPMPEPRWGHRLVAHGGRLYVIGGHGQSAHVLVYDPQRGWSTAAPLPRPRDHLSAVSVGTEIWAIGGRDGGNLSRVDVFDPIADRWRAGPALPHATSGAAEGVVEGRILIFGGEDPSLLRGGIVERHWSLDPAADAPAWQPAPPPPLAVHGADGAVLEGRMVIVGGASRHGALSVSAWTPAFQILAGPAAEP